MEKICKGECIYGKCPFPYCIKLRQKRVSSAARRDSAAILKTFAAEAAVSDKQGFGFAVDIGTTTVVVYLYDMVQGRCLAVRSSINPQTACGTDVISRISYCAEFPQGLKDQQEMIVNMLDEMFKEACEEARVEYRDTGYAVISGNTVMLHLLAGISPESMGVFPFKPGSLFGKTYSGAELGFSVPEMEIYLPECISAFVGADISSAVLASGMAEKAEDSLLMDLGTNGELVLKSGDVLYVTSAPSGPAFEGASIECGMAAVDGAVCGVSPFNGSLELKVIGDGEAVGICGSGLVDAAAFFIKAGAIDRTGLIRKPPAGFEGAGRYIVRDGENYRIQLTDRVYISQRDIREIQNAKAAVSAGVECLLNAAAKMAEEIETVYISGGFGNALNAESAHDIGLIDKRFAGKAVSIGNGSAAGAMMMLLNDSFREKADETARKCKFVPIGGDSYFEKKFIEAMDF